MRVGNPHSTSMFNPRIMRNTIAALAREMPNLQRRFDFDTIVVTGKSGIALGFALSMVTGVRVVAVRKGESSHGNLIEGDGVAVERYAFFDDGIATGSTVRRVDAEIAAHCGARGEVTPTRVLNILYSDFSCARGLENDEYGWTFRLDHHTDLRRDEPRFTRFPNEV